MCCDGRRGLRRSEPWTADRRQRCSLPSAAVRGWHMHAILPCHPGAGDAGFPQLQHPSALLRLVRFPYPVVSLHTMLLPGRTNTNSS